MWIFNTYKNTHNIYKTTKGALITRITIHPPNPKIHHYSLRHNHFDKNVV